MLAASIAWGGSALVSAQSAGDMQREQQSTKEIIHYYGRGCPHCAKVDDFFARIRAYDKYPLVKREVYFNRANAAAFTADMDRLGIPTQSRGVPTVIIGERVLSGDKQIIAEFVPVAEAYLSPEKARQKTENTAPERQTISTLKTGRDSLSTWVIMSAAAVDAINPCAFAVLLVLLGTVLAQKHSRPKVIASGLAFSVVVFMSYVLMGLGLYKALTLGSAASVFTTIIGVLAIILGLFNLKDWLWYGKTPPLEVPMSWRPRMIHVLERVTSPIGAAAAGLVVSLFLLPCTSGPYIVILGLLASSPLDAQLFWYLALYNLVFISPMIILTFLVAYGMSTDTLARLREQHIDKLHLIAGLILIGLGVFVLLT